MAFGKSKKAKDKKEKKSGKASSKGELVSTPPDRVPPTPMSENDMPLLAEATEPAIADEQVDVDELQREIESLREQLATTQATAATTIAERDAALEAAEAELSEAKETIDRLQTDLDEVMRVPVALSDEESEPEGDGASGEEMADGMDEGEGDEGTDGVDVASVDVQADSISDEEEVIDANAEKLVAVTAELEAAVATIEEQRSEMGAMSVEIQTLSNAQLDMAGQLEAACEELRDADAAKKELEAAREELRAVTAAKEALEEEATAAADREMEWVAEREGLDARIATMEEEEESDDSSSDNSASSEENLQESLDEARNTVDTLTARVKALEAAQTRATHAADVLKARSKPSLDELRDYAKAQWDAAADGLARTGVDLDGIRERLLVQL